MVRNSKKAAPQEDIELDEVDAFDANQEKVLLEEAADYAPRNNDFDDEEDSEEEVLGLDEENDEEGDNEELNSEEEMEEEELDEEDEEEESWGRKQNYYGGDDVSDEEDAKQVTEEAIRQQKKHLQELAMDDYIDEDMMEGWQKAANDFDNRTDSKSQLIINRENNSLDNLEDDEKLKILNDSFPEFIPLLKELTQLKPKLSDLQNRNSNNLVEIKIIALSAYLGAITSYFAIFSENLNSGETFSTMKDSPVMETILGSREVWRQANELPEEEIENVHENDSNEAYESVQEDDVTGSESELQDVQDEEEGEEEDEEEFVDAQEDNNKNDELDIDINVKRRIKQSSRKSTKINDYAETATPEDVDMEEKQRRKRTLRFYTSKIDQAAAKNSQERYSGDLDLPYKERLFERQQRLIEEARKRGLGENKEKLGDDLDDNDIQSDDERVAQEVNGDDYYQSVKQHKEQKQKLRRKAHEEAVKAAKEGKLAELQEEIGDDGKRAINYQILKNKGLTPHRKKENRNSRVKKRKKYEKAQKKLKSVRQVYDADNRGPYEGEKTGIKKGLSKSIKLV